MSSPVTPFAVSDADLQEAEQFCKRSGLDQIGKICAELRTLRKEYLILSHRVGRQKATIENLMPDPSRRFASELDQITTGVPDAPAKP